jgi:hypothetical protein
LTRTVTRLTHPPMLTRMHASAILAGSKPTLPLRTRKALLHGKRSQPSMQGRVYHCNSSVVSDKAMVGLCPRDKVEMLHIKLQYHRAPLRRISSMSSTHHNLMLMLPKTGMRCFACGHSCMANLTPEVPACCQRTLLGHLHRGEGDAMYTVRFVNTLCGQSTVCILSCTQYV